MTRIAKDKEVSERARHLIDAQLGERGRFAMLEELSGINTGQWKNFYYGRQLANEQMLAFLTKKYPHDAIWLLTGERPPTESDFPFLAPVPTQKDCQTVGQRLNWVIREWASPKGKDLFNYLSQRSSDTISADDWSSVVLGLSEPTAQMIAVVCTERPHFTAWVVLGSAGITQVDPTSQASVAAWKARKEADWNSLADEWERSSKKSTSKSPTTKTVKAVPKKHGNKKG